MTPQVSSTSKMLIFFSNFRCIFMNISVRGRSVRIGNEVFSQPIPKHEANSGLELVFELADEGQECMLPKKLDALGVQLGWGAPGCFFLSCIAGSHAEEANKRQRENTRNRKRNSFLLQCLSTALYFLSLTLRLLKVRNDYRIQLLHCRTGNAGWI